MNHNHTYKKLPRTKVVTLLNGVEECEHSAVEIIMANNRDRQNLSIKQAEALAKRLTYLVNLAKTKEIMES